MPLDPQAKGLLDAMESAGVTLSPELTPTQLRALLEQGAMEREPEEVARVEDRHIHGPHGAEIPVRIYWPTVTDEALPVVVFFHGGGWVIGSVEGHDAQVRQLVNRSGAIFVSVDYRLAPEHPYPAAPEDCFAATVWAAQHAASFGGDPERIAVAGDSAGGNLAAVVALMARDRGGPDLAFQLLIYPCCDMDPDRWPSMTDNAEGYFLSREMMDWFYRHYLGDGDRTDPYASPIRATDLAGLPPAHVITAEFDPLRDEGEAYAAALATGGTWARAVRYDGMFHGFFGFSAFVEAAGRAVDDAADALRRALG